MVALEDQQPVRKRPQRWHKEVPLRLRPMDAESDSQSRIRNRGTRSSARLTVPGSTLSTRTVDR